MREVRLELLRQGPAHNQLLSPLTEYLVLCGNSPANSLRIGFEHQEFLAHLSALRYDLEAPPEDQHFHLERLRTLVGKIITEMGDLESEVSAAGGSWLNLRLVISPAELSILPFEMAKSPDCFPAAELPLLLNPHRPVVLTREIRQNGSRAYHWPNEPRVLVAATDLPGAAVPIKAHLLALRRALDPWMCPDAKLARWVRVLERASVQDIIAACEEEAFTHVHILAHGDKLSNGAHGFGLLLHAPHGEGTDVVDGQRLAEALCRPMSQGAAHRRPAVVVLASCDSGARSELWYTGASMAQVLHGAGIPMVVASQFPLSKAGSVILTEELYRRLFAGEDPRQALYFARRELKVRVPKAHDDISLVAYAGLPEDLDRQLVGLRLRRAVGLLEAAKEWASLQFTKSEGPEAKSEKPAAVEPCRKAHEARLTMAEKMLSAELEELTAAHGSDAVSISEACGLLGSLYKRRAETELRQAEARDPADDQAALASRTKRWMTTLRQARDWYKQGSVVHVSAGGDRVSPWNAVQSLALSAVLEGALLGMDELWRRARASSEAAAHDPTQPEEQIWAWGSLAELWMLRPLTNPTVEGHWTYARRVASEHLEELIKRAPPDSNSDYLRSMREQLGRYATCWAQHSRSADFNKVVEIARHLLSMLTPQAR